MNQATVAILISVLSLLVSFAALGWNIYKEIGLRPRLRVSCSVITVVNGPNRANKIAFMAVNHGPGQIQIKGITLKSTWWARLRGKSKYFTLIPEWDNPLNTRLPAALAVGDQATFIVPYTSDCFLSSPVAIAGLTDTFNREHWAPRRHLRRAREQFAKDFSGTTAG